MNYLGKAFVHTDFYIKSEDEKSIELLSVGADYKERTSDDVSIGKIHNEPHE